MAGLFLGIGAGPGIGLSTARRFATEGFRVVLAARKVERLEALADDLRRGPNAGVEIASVDCSDSLQVGELVGRYAPDLEVIHAEAVGEAFWRLHAQPRDQWVWEANYG
jgi:short-subunit dehydrogenase